MNAPAIGIHDWLQTFLEASTGTEMPVLAPEARHGVAGRFLSLFEPHTEADPAAMLIQFLAAVGNAVGRNPHFEIGGSRQRLNLYVMVVGNTGAGRKGTSLDPIIGEVWGVVQRAAQGWRQSNGLSSGEGLINELRDDTETTPGILDKRLLVIEAEFGAVFARMKRDGNSLSANIREAWDGKTLRTLTKAAPMSATAPHLSIIGNITPKELRACLSGTVESSNGFANRFLWCFSHRRRSLPNPSHLEPARVAELSRELETLIGWASEQTALRWTNEACRAWEAVYDRLTEGAGEVLEEFTARGTSNVVRLASIYALLDRRTEVDVEHLTAALAVWRYTLDSCARLFLPNGSGNRPADKILRALRGAPAGLTTTDLHRVLSNNLQSERMTELLAQLREQQLIVASKSSQQKGSRYFAAEHAPGGTS